MYVHSTHLPGGPFWLKMSQSPGVLPFISHPFLLLGPTHEGRGVDNLGSWGTHSGISSSPVGPVRCCRCVRGPLARAYETKWRHGRRVLDAWGPHSGISVHLLGRWTAVVASEGPGPMYRSACKWRRRRAWPRGPGPRAEASQGGGAAGPGQGGQA